jgi:hypothetical protein
MRAFKACLAADDEAKWNKTCRSVFTTKVSNRAMSEQARQTHAFSDDQVVDVVCRWLLSQGFLVSGRRMSREHAPDITARHPAKGTWRIQVAGDMPHGAAAGLSEDQVSAHFGKAFFAAAAVAGEHAAPGTRIGLAMPRSSVAENHADRIRGAMAMLGIVMIWIEQSAAVTLDEHRSVQEGLRPEELNASNDG